MKYHQKDIVEINFLFADGTFKPHPAIIVSNDQLQMDEEGLFYLVLITSNDRINPQYSYPLTDDIWLQDSPSRSRVLSNAKSLQAISNAM